MPVAKYTDGMKRRNEKEASASATDTSRKNDGSEIAELIRKNLDAKKKAQKKCDVTYDSKCYRVVVYNMKNVTFNDAKSICKPINNGEPANIYDSSHFQLMHAFQRTQIIPPRTRMSVWTGMKYSNGKIRLSSGKISSLPFKLWYPGNPSSKRSFTNIGVNVNEDPYFNQGMFNNPPFYKLHGVMCEM
ncbi:uncharacterized protein LOC144431229 [Styela clava]